MNGMKIIWKIIYRIMYHTPRLWSDRVYLTSQMMAYIGKMPHFDNPKTFQEKVQWLKLYDRKPIYTKMVDKYEAKDFISKKVGAKYLIPTIALYDSVSDINYSALPDSFVIKTTHDSGTVVLCPDKKSFDFVSANRILNRGLKRNYFYSEREWPYKDVKPRIIVEELIGNGERDLMDYKFFCFNGKPQLMFIVSNRRLPGGHKADFFDMEGKHLNLWQKGFENNPQTPKLPPHEIFEEMKSMAAVLSEGVPLLRVDMYYLNGKIYVGELTFSDSGGYALFVPDEYNSIFGDWIEISR